MSTPVQRKILWGVVALIYAFMLTPILITAAVSFNKVERSYFPPRGFSLHWWSMAMAPQWSGPSVQSETGGAERGRDRVWACRSRWHCVDIYSGGRHSAGTDLWGRSYCPVW